jgi:hypothetical protein
VSSQQRGDPDVIRYLQNTSHKIKRNPIDKVSSPSQISGRRIKAAKVIELLRSGTRPRNRNSRSTNQMSGIVSFQPITPNIFTDGASQTFVKITVPSPTTTSCGLVHYLIQFHHVKHLVVILYGARVTTVVTIKRKTRTLLEMKSNQLMHYSPRRVE